MFSSARGGGLGGKGRGKAKDPAVTSPSTVAETSTTLVSPDADKSREGGEGNTETMSKVLDLIQPHSVSVEEVASFYGCRIDQVRREFRDLGEGTRSEFEVLPEWTGQ